MIVETIIVMPIETDTLSPIVSFPQTPPSFIILPPPTAVPESATWLLLVLGLSVLLLSRRSR